MKFTTHAFDHMDEFLPHGRWNWSPHAIGCKDLKWKKRACIEKNKWNLSEERNWWNENIWIIKIKLITQMTILYGYNHIHGWSY